MVDISNREDILDSRDIIARIEELQSEREDFASAVEDDEDDADALQALTEWDEDNADELKSLERFAGDFEGYGDWEHGESLIRASYFTEYAQEMLTDIGDMPDLPDYIVVDWEATANNLLVDYTESDFDGVTYYMRA